MYVKNSERRESFIQPVVSTRVWYILRNDLLLSELDGSNVSKHMTSYLNINYLNQCIAQKTGSKTIHTTGTFVTNEAAFRAIVDIPPIVKSLDAVR